MKRIPKIAALAAILTAAFMPVAFASPTSFYAQLTGAGENPVNASPGTALASIVFDTSTHLMQVDVTFSGLLSPTSASHIHCCTATPFLAAPNAMVATTTPTFAGFPLGVTSGTYHNVLDMTLASSYNPAFVTAKGSIGAAELALYDGMLLSEAYLNIHTQLFPGGEIRGFIRVPEPATISLLGASLAGLSFARRRQRKTAR